MLELRGICSVVVVVVIVVVVLVVVEEGKAEVVVLFWIVGRSFGEKILVGCWKKILASAVIGATPAASRRRRYLMFMLRVMVRVCCLVITVSTPGPAAVYTRHLQHTNTPETTPEHQVFHEAGNFSAGERSVLGNLLNKTWPDTGPGQGQISQS